MLKLRRHLNVLVLPLLVALAACGGGEAGQSAPDEAALEEMGPLALHGNITTLELGPVLLAMADYYPGESAIKMGGVPNLYGEVSGGGEPGVADAATNAETQLIRTSVDHPDLRMIMTVSEGLYRIVARKSAGIERVADLAGKRVATIPVTSAGYFLQKMLEEEGLGYDDLEVVSIMPMETMEERLRNREFDAVVIWEPWSEMAAQVLGDDLTEISGDGVYRELFNFNTTAANLENPEMRGRIVRMTRAIIDAAAAVREDPSRAQELVVESSGFTAQEVADAWEHHAFPAAIPEDTLDVLVEQEKWYAARDERAPRSRDELAKLIDTSVYEEAMAMGPQQPVR